MQLINSCISSAKKWLQLLPCDWKVVSASDSLDLTLGGCIWQIITHPAILTCWKTFQGLLCAGLVFLSLWLSGAPFLCVCLPQEKHLGSAALTWGCVKGGRSWGLDLWGSHRPAWRQEEGMVILWSPQYLSCPTHGLRAGVLFWGKLSDVLFWRPTAKVLVLIPLADE